MPSPIPRPQGRLTFVDLPLETQQQIIGHVDRKDLFVLQRLSPHCFFLANAEIYRTLDLKLTNSGDDDNGIPSSHAAVALQTILTSEHDYGQHIKSFRLGVIDDNVEIHGALPNRSDPLLMTRLLWDSKSDSSKFLNTALLLMTRKASIMENFQWDAPIEMSGAVYLALHKIKSLKHLRVRLDVSPLPKMVIRHGLPPNHHSATHAQHTQSLSAPSQYVPPPPPGLGSTSTGSYPGQAGASTNNIKRKKVGGNGAPNYWANPRAFFGFKYLSTLALMGMSNLDCLQEVAECIKASSATLKSLTLTLSTDLARKARKPAPVNPELDDPSDTELDDDEFLNDPLSFPPGSSLQSSPPANEADIRKEKVAQESILARVFDLQSVAAEGRKIEKKLSLSGSQHFPEQDSEAITKKVNTLMKTLMDAPIASDTDPSSTTTRLDHFKMIREVADLYITSQSVQRKFLKDQAKPPGQPAKKPASSSKPLNPLASDFKLSGSTIQSPGLGSSIETDLAALANSSLLGATGSSSVLNGTQKPPAPMSAWPSSSSPPYTNTNALPSTIHNSMGSTEKSKSLASSVPNTQHLIQQAQKIAQLKAQQAHVQAYMSPYSIGSYANTPVPPNALTPYQDGSNTNTGVFDATTPYSPYQPASSNGPVPTSGLNPGSLDELFLPPKNGASNITKKAKAKTQKAKKAGPAKVTAVADSGEEPETPEKTSPSATHPFFVACKTSEPAEDDMDIDMEHPDEDPEEMGEDQEILPEAEEVEVPTPRKRAKFELAESISPPLTNRESPLSPKAEATSTLDTMSSDEAMQSYIRAAHGLQLESLSLEWVPLKASIVARALDLSVLKRLTLLEVGQQDAFWTLLLRLQGTSPEISFKSIHTDNVSLPFMKFLATFEGLEELFMHERGTKQVEESATGPPISITVIRKLALQKHANTIKLLMIRNERNDSWDMDTKTLQFLAVKGTELRELGVSLNMKTYHVLMQYFAAFKNLYALHLIALRSGDRGILLQNESLEFAVDSLSHCPNMKLKYIAIANSVVALELKPEYLNHHMTIALERLRDKKGKGKAHNDSLSSLMDSIEDSASEEVDGFLAQMMAGKSRLKILLGGFGDADEVRIFARQIRLGKL